MFNKSHSINLTIPAAANACSNEAQYPYQDETIETQRLAALRKILKNVNKESTMKKIIASIAPFLLITSIAFAAPQAYQPAQHNVVKVQIIQKQFNLTKASFQSVSLITQGNNTYGVKIELTKTAAKRMHEITAENINHTLNLVVNKRVISSATIVSALDNNFELTGLTKHQAEEFVREFKN